MMKTKHNLIAWLGAVALACWATTALAAPAPSTPAKETPKAAPAKAAPAKAAPAQQAPAKTAAEKKTPASPDKKAPDTKVPDKKAPDKKVPDTKTPDKKELAKKTPEKKEPPKPKLPPIPKWEQPNVAKVRAEVFAWLDAKKVDAATRAKADQIWAVPAAEQLTGTDLLVRAAATFALADANARKLVDLCSRPRSVAVVPDQAWLRDPKATPLVANNLRLLFGRWLAHEALYDEALEELRSLNPADVVDPASLLFYQSVVCHRLLDRDGGLRTIEGLMKNPDQSPRRYVVVAGLMEEDLKGLKDDSLDHIARRMGDIERRLDLGRAGHRVRKVEDGVIDSLDKLIKKLEEEKKKKGGGGGASGNNIRSQSPAKDSRIIRGKGPGDVTKRDIGSKDGWGNLPPKKREEALQAIGRDFPSHYRDKIEQYFRKLANQNGESPNK